MSEMNLSPVYTAQTNPGSTWVKTNPPPEVGSTRVEPGLAWKSVL